MRTHAPDNVRMLDLFELVEPFPNGFNLPLLRFSIVLPSFIAVESNLIPHHLMPLLRIVRYKNKVCFLLQRLWCLNVTLRGRGAKLRACNDNVQGVLESKKKV